MFIKNIDEKIEIAENKIYLEKVLRHPSRNVNISFADGFIHGQVSMRKNTLKLIDEEKERIKALIRKISLENEHIYDEISDLILNELE